VGEGNWVSLKSVEADSRLLWRSSKLTEGRKSKEAVVESAGSSVAPFLPPKEKREWLLADEALSIGASAVDRRMDPIFVGLVLVLPLSPTDEKLADRGTGRECRSAGVASGCQPGLGRSGEERGRDRVQQPCGELGLPSWASGDLMVPVHGAPQAAGR